MKHTELNIGLIGQGAIGCLFSHYWRHENITIFPNHWPSESKAIVDLAHKVHSIDHPKRKICAENLTNLDVLIITVKAYQTANVAKLLKGQVNEPTQILLIQNGMGGHETLHRYLPDNPLYAGITTDAVYSTDANIYQITAEGKLELGLMYPPVSASLNINQIERIKEFLSIHPNAEFHENIKPHLYNKLAINAVINPLTALKNIKNGELLNYPKHYKQLIKEVVLVFQYLEVAADEDDLTRKIESVMRATKANYSSMHQDYHNGRTTEIDSMLGFLINHANEGYIHVPFMREIHQKISTHK